MTEIQVFPAGMPPMPVDEPGDTSNLHGLLAALHLNIGRLANRLPDPHRELLNEAQALYPIRIDPTPIPASGLLDQGEMFGPKMGQNWDVHTISVTGFTVGTTQGFINQPGSLRYSQTAGTSNPVPSQPAVPGSTVPIQNPNTYPVNVVISGGTVTAVVVNGVTVGTGDGPYIVPAAGSISVTYSVAPTWVWSNANGLTASTGAAQIQFYGKGQCWLRGNGERLIFAGPAGALVSFDATRVADFYVGRYFL